MIAQMEVLPLMLAGEDFSHIKVQWNESGKSHTEWDYLKVCKLAKDMHTYVESKVVKQQDAEEKIIGAKTDKQAEKILKGLSYD